jgi:phage tail-like protein
VTDREFKVQVIETTAQWKSGLSSRLELGEAGLALFLNPAFDSWIKNVEPGVSDIVVDDCGQTYWTSLETPAKYEPVWRLLRHNPITDQVEHVLTFAGCGLIEPRELWLTSDYLWIFDRGDADRQGHVNGRMLALGRDTYQIIHEFRIENLIDADFEIQGSSFYALVHENDQMKICRYSTEHKTAFHRQCFTLKDAKGANAIAVGKDGYVYVLDAVKGQIVRFNPATQQEIVLSANQGNILQQFKTTAMQVDQRGVIFLAANAALPQKPARVYMFDADGSYLGALELPTKSVRARSADQNQIEEIRGIGFDGGGGVYLATNLGLAKFTLNRNPIGQEGIYYARTLDNGEKEGLWHRIALEGILPSKSSIEVYYYASDNQALRDAYERALNEAGQSIEDKARRIESLLSSHWIGPDAFKAAAGSGDGDSDLNQVEDASPDLIFNPNKGRFLWFKLKLKTFDQKSRPSIGSARVYYPRLSYLRYLPPLYREEPVSAAFLERFLSIFETTFEGLDQEIDRLFHYFDPSLAPKDFLPWLASWINLSLDEDLPEARVRRFIQRAPYLYSRKGTAASLTEFLKIYTDMPVYLSEHLTDGKPLVLGLKDWTLGSGLSLLGSGPRGMRVGHTTVVGHSAVRDRVSDPDEPFLRLARRFSVVLNMDRNEFEKRKATLQRIIREQSPAHTSFTIRVSGDQTALGEAVLGVSAGVQKPKPYRIGLTQLGSGSALAKGPQALRVERGAWVGGSGRL